MSSITFQYLIPHHSHISTPCYSPNSHISCYLKPPNNLIKTPKHPFTILPYHSQTLKSIPFNSFHPLKSSNSDSVLSPNTDDILYIAEFISLTSSAILSIAFVLNNFILSSKKPVFLEFVGTRVYSVWQPVLLIVGIVIGVVIRRREWRRVCLGFRKPGSGSGENVVNLVERVEKLEEDLRSSVSVVRVLSRQLEKLGIRFRVTRKSMKDPIAQTAELAQKNSEATRALALQEDNLEKELAEIQKVLLAMQDQQQKQLELILAIAKSGKLLDNKPVPSQDQKKVPNVNLTGSSISGGNR
uniref:uncharacterized protein LOC122605860 n=1 Tax=Erigeron canadensis TaxID=72917 RepID=UPI001CB97455|nr:uncharacterized protein LOC122605860 [Erigeron canadensis]